MTQGDDLNTQFHKPPLLLNFSCKKKKGNYIYAYSLVVRFILTHKRGFSIWIVFRVLVAKVLLYIR